MARPFGTYNIAAHNRVLGRLRTDRANRRNAFVLEVLRSYPDPIPSDRAALYAIVGTLRGTLPPSVLERLARQVRKEREVAI